MSNPSRRLFFAMATVLSLLSSASNAAVIYDEAGDGDLFDGGGFGTGGPREEGSTLLVLANGTNTILGSSTALVDAPGSNGLFITDWDDILFQVGPGQSLTAITYRVLSGPPFPNTLGLTTSYVLFALDPSPSDQILSTEPFLDVLQFLPLAIFDNALPLGVATYFLDQNGFSMSKVGGLQGGGTWSYAIDIEVAEVPVPIPAAAWLLSSGLLALFGMMRRRAAAG